ncbi:hypothetical protein FE257_012276 [Aspergillus nanangensis]|uniref:Phosphatidate phosphatase APP1 catalytic domain-containing protein n=1 Tax=Aspergillus nanangensis TaxID=2582783 RepID=A0AAD4GQV3_ASPNN|nr:hypothetical protein FE257_012276 [Aspergillus nanangensis]
MPSHVSMAARNLACSTAPFATPPASKSPHPCRSAPVLRRRVFGANYVAHSATKLVTTSPPFFFQFRQVSSAPASLVRDTAPPVMPPDKVPQDEGKTEDMARPNGQVKGPDLDPESDEDVPVEAEELQEALARPPPVHSSYLPLPWKGRLGYACLNTYLRYSNPSVFCSRTCRIASILENRYPLQDPSQPPHPTKNRPDRGQTPDVARGQGWVEALGLANTRDIVKILRWNDRYGIRFMRLSSEMFPFASHKEYGYKLAPFASEVLADAGRVVAELGHRVSVHPGQFTQLGSPRKEVFESSVRDLEYHSEMLQLLRLPPQQDRDAVMILHMGGVFGDRQATLDRFRENYQTLSKDIKNRLVLENDDVSCQVREGTLDIMNIYDRIKATWTKKNITQKMHYSEPQASAVTNRQRRKHSDRVKTLPPCDPTMDLMIEAKDKEQAVFELMRNFKLPGHELLNDIVPYTRSDENKPFKPPRKTKKNGGFVDLEGQIPPPRTIPDEDVGMGGPEGRVYWPPGMEEWLRPKKVVRGKPAQSPRGSLSKKREMGGDEEAQPNGAEAESILKTPVSKAPPRVQRTSSVKRQSTTRKRKASPVISTTASDSDAVDVPAPPKLRRTQSTRVRRSQRTQKVDYAEDSEAETLAPKLFSRSRWRAPPPTSPARLQFPSRSPPSHLRFPPRFSPRDRNPQGKLLRLFQTLFGSQASLRVQNRLSYLRYESISAIRHRAQSRIYRAIVKRQARLLQRRKLGRRGALDILLGRGKQLDPSIRGIARTGGQRKTLSQRNNTGPQAGRRAAEPLDGLSSMSAPPTWAAGSGPGGERGGRRKKVFEYLKAANELRQTYAAQWAAQREGARDYNEEYLNNTPGAFPDVEIARSGSEEMVIFPSYARRVMHDKSHDSYSRRRRGSTSTIDEYRGVSDDAEPGASEWEIVADENAVVAVDVRGWVYSPHRGPMTRKHRLMITLARKLSGVPAPVNSSNDTDESNIEKMTGKREDEIVEEEIQSIMKNGRAGSDWKAGVTDDTDEGLNSERPSQKVTEAPQLSKDELSMANAHLMERLRPFLTNPVAGVPVTVFFFNDSQSQSRSIITDESGHFALRAMLPFIPTHIRALASEDLSAMKKVEVIEPTGVSLISDIDDTVKHSAIANGAKEMFRNTFVRELSDLTVDGVADWYNKLAKMGVDIHYVSNAPWQLYPLLDRYFKMVGLPPGSVHLKSYSGMLQGIFEPTSERKKGSLEQILRDFPERKFILVGDSGEADLEVYTDIVLTNPGRILGVFIRDITTTVRKQFFEKSVDHLDSTPRSRSTPQLVDHADAVSNRPALPPRQNREAAPSSSDTQSLDMDDLIDLRDEEDRKELPPTPTKPSNLRAPPVKPSKPSSLRAVANSSDPAETASISSTQTLDPIKRKPAPPLPRRLSPAKTTSSLLETDTSWTEPSNNTRPSTASSLPTRPKLSSETNTSGAQERSKRAPPPPPPRRTNTSSSTASQSTPPPPSAQPPQKQQSYPAAAAAAALQYAQYASERIPWSASPSNLLRSTASNPSLSRTGSASTDSDLQAGAAIPSKREELWRRRWERAQDLLADQGVVLGSWRVGKDMQDVSAWLVKEALKDNNLS